MCGVNMGGLLGLKADFEVVDKLLETGREHGEKMCVLKACEKASS